MAELVINWRESDADWVGDCDDVANLQLLIQPSQWGKVMLRVFHRGAEVYTKEASDADAAKEAALPAVRLIALRESA